MKISKACFAAGLSAVSMMTVPVFAGVTPEEAGKLKTVLTPLGAERSGNKDGSIPAWTGTPTTGAEITQQGRRKDPFSGEKPLYSVTIKNMEQHADKLTEGTKAVLKKYPESLRLDVYKTHRTGIAPQWIYDQAAKNAVSARLIEGGAGLQPDSFYGAIPFPIPKNGLEVLWNSMLGWKPTDQLMGGRNYQVTQDGKWILVADVLVSASHPQLREGKQKEFDGEILKVRQQTFGPAIRSGEGIVGREQLDATKSNSWVYLTGQRRVRKLPNPCCDTPGPFSAGVASFDEVNTFNGRHDLFDWKLVGKKEILIPYNTNRTLQPAKDSDLFGPKHLNPDFVRWELHRVWVVEATLREGKRHTSPKSRYYFDEDTWINVMGERYDASGTLARVPFVLPIHLSEVPATVATMWSVYDLIGGSSFVSTLFNEKTDPQRPMPPFKDAFFTADAMAGEGVR